MEGKGKIDGEAKKRSGSSVVAAFGCESEMAWDKKKENERITELD
jgi:hypothetical protein